MPLRRPDPHDLIPPVDRSGVADGAHVAAAASPVEAQVLPVLRDGRQQLAPTVPRGGRQRLYTAFYAPPSGREHQDRRTVLQQPHTGLGVVLSTDPQLADHRVHDPHFLARRGLEEAHVPYSTPPTTQRNDTISREKRNDPPPRLIPAGVFPFKSGLRPSLD